MIRGLWMALLVTLAASPAPGQSASLDKRPPRLGMPGLGTRSTGWFGAATASWSSFPVPRRLVLSPGIRRSHCSATFSGLVKRFRPIWAGFASRGMTGPWSRFSGNIGFRGRWKCVATPHCWATRWCRTPGSWSRSGFLPDHPEGQKLGLSPWGLYGSLAGTSSVWYIRELLLNMAFPRSVSREGSVKR